MINIETNKARILRRWTSLKTERSAWMQVWKQIADFIQPRRFRDSPSQRNRPCPNEKLINNTPVQAARTLAAGLMSGLTSPARPWFRLGVPGFRLTQNTKAWISQVESILREVLVRSNVYNCLAHVFGDLGTFCVAAMLLEEDDKEVVRGYVLPLGSFVLTTSARGQVDGMMREVPMTVGMLEEQFGLANCSQRVKDAWDRHNYDEVIEVLHAVEPNPDYLPGSRNPDQMQWRSYWFELRSDTSSEIYLRKGGYHEFPVMAPRWSVTGTDTYGSGPGFDALGDAKALQALERRKAQLIDKLTTPPMVAPTALRAGRPSLLPGDVTFLDKIAGSQGFEPAMVVHPQAIPAVDSVMRQHEDRINRSFYVDLWLAITMDDRNQRATAREVAERHEEKLLTLGPVLERLHDELLDKLIERLFFICLRRGIIPPPPPELQGAPIRVEYISVMASAQKLLGVAAVERLASFIGNMSAAAPSVMDKFNADRAVERYADMLGTEPDLLYTEEEVAQHRAQRQAIAEKQRQQELALKQGPDMAKSAQLLSQTDVNGTSALNRILAAQGAGPLSGAGGQPTLPGPG